MKVKVYHVETDKYRMIISPSILPHGYIEVDTFDAERCWQLCNWVHWSEAKPKEVHSDIDSCNHGLIVHNPDTNEYWLALSNGWLNSNIEEIKGYVERNWQKTFWDKYESEVLG